MSCFQVAMLCLRRIRLQHFATTSCGSMLPPFSVSVGKSSEDELILHSMSQA